LVKYWLAAGVDDVRHVEVRHFVVWGHMMKTEVDGYLNYDWFVKLSGLGGGVSVGIGFLEGLV
jgi:hypothetical protein